MKRTGIIPIVFWITVLAICCRIADALSAMDAYSDGKEMKATECAVTLLAAAFRNGQVFLQWQEDHLPDDFLLNVYRHSEPITDESLPHAVRIGHHIQPGSARDWWQDPSAFKEDEPQGEPVGFVIGDGLPPLSPESGLFVHTVAVDEDEQQYYAVTVSRPDGTEIRKMIAGRNSLRTPVSQRQMPTQALWVGSGDPPAVPANLPVVLRLAGGAGPNDPDYNYLAFGDATMGWRESLPFKLKVKLGTNCLNVFPSDRVWYNRSLGGPVGHFKTPTGIALHFGYNSNIYDADAMVDGVIVNYNEKRILWILDWVHRAFKTDPARVHAIGASGGGAGLMLALHHPSVFASVCTMVPCVSYRSSSDPAMASNDVYTKVLKMLCGDYDGGVRYAPELGGFDYLDGASCLRRHREFPFLVLTHGRNDRPTPWSKVPEFCRALNENRVGCLAWWDDGEHGTAGKNAPEDVRRALSVDFLLEFSKNTSFPAFSNGSDSRDPGNGDPEDGDIVGWMNRGFTWSDIADTERSYSISIRMAHPDVTYPVTTDVTLRNTQKFKPRPGQVIRVAVDHEALEDIVADENGCVTAPGVSFPSPAVRCLEFTYPDSSESGN